MTQNMNAGDGQADDDFLIREGLELLAAYRRIRSTEARKAVLKLIASIVEAEKQAATRPDRPD